MPRKATGSAYERDKKLYAYVTLPGGKRKPFPCPDKIRTLKQAKDYSAWLNEQIRLGNINPDALAAKPAEPLDKAATFEGWCGKWLDERATPAPPCPPPWGWRLRGISGARRNT